MKSWENQVGYPVVNVGLDNSNRDFFIMQERYYAATEERIVGDERSWYIPLNFATQSNPDFDDTTFTDYFVNDPQPIAKRIHYPDAFDSNQWFIFNKQQIGYYRVNYEISNWNKIIAALNSPNFNQIHVLNRAQLIDDSLNLAADGYLNYKIALQVLSYLERETDYIPWRAAVNNLDKLQILINSGSESTQVDFRKFIVSLLQRTYKHYENNVAAELMDKFGRELAIDWTCRMGEEECLSEAYENVQLIVVDEQEISASLEVVYLCNGLKGGSKQDEFNFLWQKMLNSDDQAQRIRIIDGLLCSSDADMLSELLQDIFDNKAEPVYRAHERSRILNNVFIKSDVGLTVLTEYLSESYEQFKTM